jgi:hypothetical protein
VNALDAARDYNMILPPAHAFTVFQELTLMTMEHAKIALQERLLLDLDPPNALIALQDTRLAPTLLVEHAHLEHFQLMVPYACDVH